MRRNRDTIWRGSVPQASSEHDGNNALDADVGQRPGLTTDEREHLRELERENKELRRANEILKAAASFFGAELDRRPPR